MAPYFGSNRIGRDSNEKPGRSALEVMRAPISKSVLNKERRTDRWMKQADAGGKPWQTKNEKRGEKPVTEIIGPSEREIKNNKYMGIDYEKIVVET